MTAPHLDPAARSVDPESVDPASPAAATIRIGGAYRFFLPLIFMTELNMISKSVIHAFLARADNPSVALAGFNEDELAEITRWAWERDVVPRFIELMPMASGELFVPGELMAAAEIRDRVAQGLDLRLRPDDGAGVAGAGPATYWRAEGGRFRGRRLGTIAAMTEHFCERCNRLRVSATGRLHACLARDETGDLRAALRSSDPDRLEAVVRSALGTKRDGHGFNIDGSGGPSKAMVSIGG